MSVDRMLNFSKILVSVVSAIIVAAIMGWIQLNARISVLEVQVRNDRELYQRNAEKSDKQMPELTNKINDIQMKVTELSVKVQEDK